MATGDTLATLIEEVQYELGQVVSPAVGQNFREHIKSRIRREYRRLYHDHDWRHLRVRRDITLAAGQRYYDYPTGLSIETTTAIYRKWSGVWDKIEDDLQEMDLNGFDSDLDVRADPPLKWRPAEEDQIEVWPIPASNLATLRFVAKRPFAPLVDESDRCDLDTDLVVLHVAAELLRKQDENEAALILGRATQHYATLKQRSRKAVKRVNLAGAGDPQQMGFQDKIIVGVETR